MSDPFAALRDVLSTEELIYPDSPSYVEESRTWSAQKDMKPRVVARPKELASLSHLVAFLEDSDLDFAVRCSGCGSASSKDVLISMSAFDHFEFDADNETILVGAGQVWGEVDRKMEQYAPGYAGTNALRYYWFFAHAVGSNQCAVYIRRGGRLNHSRRSVLALLGVRTNLGPEKHA